MQTPMLTVIRDIVAAAGQTEAFATDAHFHLRIENAPYQRLVIESWPTPDPLLGETRRISVAHYYEQHGDLMADPEMELTDNGYPISIKMDGAGVYRCCYWRNETGQVMERYRERQDQLAFLRMWARNIRAQGFIRAAKVPQVSR